MLGDAAAPVIWDSEALGNACEGLKGWTSNKAWYEPTSINNRAQLGTTNKSIPSGTQYMRWRHTPTEAMQSSRCRNNTPRCFSPALRFQIRWYDKHTVSFGHCFYSNSWFL